MAREQIAPPPLWTMAQLAEYVGVPESTIETWRGSGKAPKAIKIGKHVRFRWQDVAEWIDDLAREQHPEDYVVDVDHTLDGLSTMDDLARLVVEQQRERDQANAAAVERLTADAPRKAGAA